MVPVRPSGGALSRIREFLSRSPAARAPASPGPTSPRPASRVCVSPDAAKASVRPVGLSQVECNGDDVRAAVGDLAVLVQQLAPAVAQLAPALGEFSPLFPLLTSCSVRMVGALSPLAPVAAVTMPAVAEYTGICTRQLIELLPEVGPLLFPVGRELGSILVALGPLLGSTTEFLVAATNLLVASVELAGGFAPMLAQVLPAVTGSQEGEMPGSVAIGQSWAGLASRLRGLPLAGPADRALAGARSGCRLVLVSAAGSASQLLPAVAPSVQAGAARVLIMVLPAVPGAMTRTAAVITRLTPVLEPVVRGGTWVAVTLISRLTGFVAAAPDAPRAGTRPSPLSGTEFAGGRSGRAGSWMTARGGAAGLGGGTGVAAVGRAGGAALPDQRVVPLISIVIYVNGQP